jgi:uncharacterized phosphosugar-binding protein
MSAKRYFEQINKVIEQIQRTQMPVIEKAAARIADSIAQGGRAYVFGSGHSVIPALDIFPRYGSFVGFYPIYDPRLMWFNVVGPGGARELLWLERQENYARVLLSSYVLEPRDCMLIYSHGGLNAVPIEMAIESKKLGLTVISVTSHANLRAAKATHSSGQKLAEASDLSIDNCVPPEDALVSVEGIPEKLAAGSTVAVVTITMALVAEVGAQLARKGHKLHAFVSPNLGLPADHNQQVFIEYTRTLASRKP